MGCLQILCLLRIATLKAIFTFVFASSLRKQTLIIYCPLGLLYLSNIHKDVTILQQEKEPNEQS